MNPATPSSPSAKARGTLASLSPASPGVIVAAAILLLAALGFGAASSRYRLMLTKEAVQPPEGRQLMALPRETESWKAVGNDRRETADVEKVLGTTNYVTRVYVRKDTMGNPRPMVIDFHAAYYTGMIDTVPHVPDRCFVGGGLQLGNVVGDLPLALDDTSWQPVSDVPEELSGKVYSARLSNRYSERPGQRVTLPKDPRSIRLRTMQFLDHEQKPFYAGYFFIANGGHVSRSEGVRLLAFDLRTRYAFYAKVQVTSNTVASGEELAEQASSLLGELLPEVMLCLPDWLELDKKEAAAQARR